MLSEKQIPNFFCPEAVNWAIHILNQSPSPVVKEATPKEVWSGNKPVLHYLKVFRCIALVHIQTIKDQNWMIKVRDVSYWV